MAYNPYSLDFYHQLPPLTEMVEVLKGGRFTPVPGDWLAVVGDIESSTALVAQGRQSDVNFIAAALITVLTNVCGQIPFQFGGDGAVALIPSGFAAEAMRALAQIRRLARNDFGVGIRVGLVSVAELRRLKVDVRLARYETTSGNSSAHFQGGGISLLERSIKGRGDPNLARLAQIAEIADDGAPPDLTGLSCRWEPIRSTQGQIVALVTRGAEPALLLESLLRIAGLASLALASREGLSLRWPARGLLREARARKGNGSLAWSVIQVLADTFMAYLVVNTGIRLGSVSGDRYRDEVLRNILNFARCDENFDVVYDCPAERVDEVVRFLEAEARTGRLSFGIHISSHAVMTCLVRSIEAGLHVHFGDGGDGGFTQAATALKRQIGGAIPAVG